MSKMHRISNKFSKNRQALGTLRLQSPLTFHIGDLKLHVLTKLWIFKLVMKKSNFKKISYNVILVTSSSLRNQKLTKITSQKIFPIRALLPN